MDKIALFCDRFEIIERHSGGMANVLICRDIHNHRIVAAKTPHFAPELFSREARMWLGLGQHPNIVRAHIVHNIEGVPFLFMDFVGDAELKSQNLRQALIKTRNLKNVILNVGISVVKALRYTRSVYPGFVHRDIKPENILIDKKENVYLTDFGIGHIPRVGFHESINKSSSQYITGKTLYTKTGSFIGTIGYASPEQYFDSSNVNYKADIYSLGVVLFEALFGKLPFDTQLIEENGHKTLNQPLKIDNRQKGFKAEISKLLKSMLDFQGKNRPESLDYLEKEFDRLKTNYGQGHTNNKARNLNNYYVANEPVRLNRIYSLIELNEQELAISNIISFQKAFPFSKSCKTIIHKLFQKLPEELGWKFFKKAAKTDFTNPRWLAGFLFSVILIVAPFIFLKMDGYITAPFGFSSVSILILLIIERYINARTSLTLDKITLWGIVVGYASTLIISFFEYQAPAGSIGKSFLGSVIGFFIPLSVAWIYRSKTNKDAVGGGTIKLSAMIGSWVGLLIIPILIIALLILFFQGAFQILISKLPGELKWSANTLVPRLLKKFRIAVPTSTSFFYSTWILLIFTGIKLGNEYFFNHFDWIIVRFLPYLSQ